MTKQLVPVKMRKYRESQEMTRQKLSAKCGVNGALIGKIEAGRYIPYDSELKRIADALGVDNPDELLEPLAEVN